MASRHQQCWLHILSSLARLHAWYAELQGTSEALGTVVYAAFSIAARALHSAERPASFRSQHHLASQCCCLSDTLCCCAPPEVWSSANACMRGAALTIIACVLVHGTVCNSSMAAAHVLLQVAVVARKHSQRLRHHPEHHQHRPDDIRVLYGQAPAVLQQRSVLWSALCDVALCMHGSGGACKVGLCTAGSSVSLAGTRDSSGS
jgi:hypothetical protein